MEHSTAVDPPMPQWTPSTESAARHIDRAGTGLGYGLWAGFLGAASLGMVYLIIAGAGLVVLGLGVVVLPVLVGWLYRLAHVFADKASYVVGHRLLVSTPEPRTDSRLHRFADVVRAPMTYRASLWALVMGVTGIIVGSLVLLVVFAFARELTVPLWWWLVPPGMANTALGLPIESWTQTIAAVATAPLYLALALWVLPPLARAQARLCAAILGCRAPVAESSNDVPDVRADVERSVPEPSPSSAPHAITDPRIDRLTPREAEVLDLMAQGMDNAAIAETLVVSQAAVLKHVRSIFVKIELPPGENGHRRVLAVLAYLSQRGSADTTIARK